MRGEQFWLDKTRAAQLRPRYTLTPSIVLRGGKPCSTPRAATTSTRYSGPTVSELTRSVRMAARPDVALLRFVLATQFGFQQAQRRGKPP
jgi:hypothetical protein